LVGGAEIAALRMPCFHFKLVDTTFVSAIGTHELPDDKAAEADAIVLAETLRAARPQLIGVHYSISVTRGDGAGVCMVPLDVPA
jgi:hypothetical protein